MSQYDLQLIEAPVSNPDASEAMSLAHELKKKKGLSMSEALAEAWSMLRDKEKDEKFPQYWEGSLDEDKEDDEQNPIGVDSTSALLILGLIYALWAYSQKSWTQWTPLTQNLSNRLRAITAPRPAAPVPSVVTEVPTMVFGTNASRPSWETARPFRFD